MKPYTKMMLMGYGNKPEERREPRSNYPDMEYGGENGAESRFRDRRGREHYDNGRFAPARSEMPYGGFEMRQNVFNMRQDRSGRDGGRQGGNRMPSSGMDEDEEMRGDYWPMPPYTVPHYGGGENMNEIGFERGMNANYESGDEMTHRHGEKVHGYAEGANEFTHETAKEWTSAMHNEDGTKGPHWTMDQVKQVMSQRGVKHDPAVFWAILNSMYSDYCAVFKKHGVNNMDFYVDMACAWINDKDAVKDKAGAYFEYVVKH